MRVRKVSRVKQSLYRRFASRLRRNYGILGWVILSVSVTGTIFLGAIGFEKNLAANAPYESFSLMTRIFMAVQMLTLNKGDSAEPVSWELETARVLALLAFSAAVLKASVTLFQEQLASIALRFISNHSIVCGIDRKGNRLASELLELGTRVVLIDSHSELSAICELRELGAYEVIGDATSQSVLTRAGVHRAKRLVIVSGTDTMNVKIAAVANEVCRQHRPKWRGTLPVHVHCTDPRLFSLLERQRDAAVAESRTEYRRCDVMLNSARSLLESHPLDRVSIAEDSDITAQVIFLGFTEESQSILLQVARLGHFANLQRARVVVVSPDVAIQLQKLRFRYPQIDNVLELEHITRDLDHVETMADVERLVKKSDTLTTVIIANENEHLSLQVASALPLVVNERWVPVHIRLDNQERFGRLLQMERQRSHWFPFGSVTEAGNATMVIGAELDEMAKAIHADYVRQRKEDGDMPQAFPSICPWDKLSEGYREANRHQADHLTVKLRAVDCKAIAASTCTEKIHVTWTDAEIETMAKMEHHRWNANRWLEGWQCGPRDDSKKLHPNLVSWEETDETNRDYDRNAVRKIPELLELVGQVVVRRSRVDIGDVSDFNANI